MLAFTVFHLTGIVKFARQNFILNFTLSTDRSVNPWANLNASFDHSGLQKSRKTMNSAKFIVENIVESTKYFP